MLKLVNYYIVKDEKDWKSSIRKGISRDGSEKYYLGGIKFWNIDRDKPDKFPAAYKYDPPYDYHWDDGHVIPCPLEEAKAAIEKECLKYVDILRQLKEL